MTIHDWIGEPGADVVFDGDQIAEFCDIMESAGQARGIDMHHLRCATKIIGRYRARLNFDDASLFGVACGRNWYAELEGNPLDVRE